jgi:hypothetical protein
MVMGQGQRWQKLGGAQQLTLGVFTFSKDTFEFGEARIVCDDKGTGV